MRKRTAIAAACAAAMTTFAAHAEAPRDGGKIMAEALAAAAKKAPKAQKSAHSARKRHVAKARTISRHTRRVVHAEMAPPDLDMTTTASISKADQPKEELKSSNVAATQTGSGPYGNIIARYSKEYGVTQSLARAVIRVESNYNPHKRGLAGEVGLMQIKPATARMLGYSGSIKQLYNPETNIKWGMKYLGMAQDVGNGTTCGTLLKYNAGHGARHMNPVSAAYCVRVKAELADAST